jgi:uncharacterized protein (TIGR00251 family)
MDPLIINVRVQPKSKQQKIEKLDNSQYKAWVHAAPDKGNANKEVIKLLAKYFHLPTSCLTIVAGQTSRNKKIEICNLGLSER